MKRVLITYFSASGVTKNVASLLSKATGGDLIEIVPEEIYTKADLNWLNTNSRSTLEMKDKSSRPPIKNKINNINDYQVIFIGFPIWWYREPSIIDTFIEQYDLSNKKVILFATSGGSGINGAINNTKTLKGNPNIIDGRRLGNNVSLEEIKSWANNYL